MTITPDMLAELQQLTPDELELLEAELARRAWEARWSSWTPYPWQVCPGEVETHGMWLQLGGRGTGKTDGCARYMVSHVNGPACDPRLPGGHRMSIIAPTQGDAVESAVNGPSGLKAHDPRVVLRTTVGGTYAKWPSGAEAKLFGAHGPDDVERLRSGGNRCLVWLEEAAAMRHLGPALAHSAMGLRIGARPHYIASTTPKPRREIVELLARPDVLTTRGRTRDAHHLPQMMRDKLTAQYAGTRLERQELDGELLQDVDGALWTWQLLDRLRVGAPRPMSRIVVAIDPAVSNTADSDETGIVVVGIGAELMPDKLGQPQHHAYVLDDLSGHYHPHEWAAAALQAYDTWGADRIIGEVNNGGDMIRHTLHSVRPGAPFAAVSASRGKQRRAEPVAALYEQHRVHHVGAFAELEDEMTTWVPGEPGSPDRMDALVWAVTHLMVKARGGFAAVA